MREVSTLFLVHFIFSLNFNSTYPYKFDCDTKKVMGFIQNQESDKTISIGVGYLFNPSTHYYCQKMKLGNLHIDRLTNCWEHELKIEELQARYYGIEKKQKNSLSLADAQKITSYKNDFYYLNIFFYNELIRLKYNLQYHKFIKMSVLMVIRV